MKSERPADSSDLGVPEVVEPSRRFDSRTVAIDACWHLGSRSQPRFFWAAHCEVILRREPVRTVDDVDVVEDLSGDIKRSWAAEREIALI